MSILTLPSPGFQHRILDLFKKLSESNSWANARDVKQLAKDMFGKLIQNAPPPITSLVLTEEIVIQTMDALLTERSSRGEAMRTSQFPSRDPLPSLLQTQQKEPPKNPILETGTKSALQMVTEKVPPSPNHKDEAQKSPEVATKVTSTEDEPEWFTSIFKAKRDPGVSDAV